jgi:hypothetical protein
LVTPIHGYTGRSETPDFDTKNPDLLLPMTHFVFGFSLFILTSRYLKIIIHGEGQGLSSHSILVEH